MNQPTPRRRYDVLSIFVLTAVVAVVVTPWYGLTEGFSAWHWLGFVIFMAWNGLSITAGYHRLWSHRAYEAHPVIRVLFALGGALAVQNSIKTWCSNHRNHHRYVDDEKMDPYSARKGLWFSHMGWMLAEYPASRVSDDNVTDLLRDPIVVWQDKWYWPLSFSLNVLLTLFLGYLAGDAIAGLLLMGFLRLFLCHHTTFFINSLAHSWGSQPYSDEMTARDNPIVALLTYGEGYHNFHHTFQWDYRNGLRWYQFDPTKWLIRGLSVVRLTHGLKRVAPEKIEQRVVDMQMRRARELITRRVWPSTDEMKQRLEKLEEEYQHLVDSLNEWAACRQQWLELKKADFARKWEENELRLQLRSLEANLALQRYRWQMLTTQFA